RDNLKRIDVNNLRSRIVIPAIAPAAIEADIEFGRTPPKRRGSGCRTLRVQFREGQMPRQPFQPPRPFYVIGHNTNPTTSLWSVEQICSRRITALRSTATRESNI